MMTDRRGFSLLEILLALAIFGGTLAVLSQIVGTGGDAGRSARDLVLVRLLCQAKMTELIVAGIMPIATPPQPMESPDSGSLASFVCAVDVVPAPIDGLLAIRVSVQAESPDGGPPSASYSLTRWIIDPTLGLEAAEAEAAADAEASQAMGDLAL